MPRPSSHFSSSGTTASMSSFLGREIIPTDRMVGRLGRSARGGREVDLSAARCILVGCPLRISGLWFRFRPRCRSRYSTSAILHVASGLSGTRSGVDKELLVALSAGHATGAGAQEFQFRRL